MKKIITEYLGVLFLYSVIFFGVILLNARFKYLNELEVNDTKTVILMGGSYE